jgi:FkbM family methyltransferase
MPAIEQARHEGRNMQLLETIESRNARTASQIADFRRLKVMHAPDVFDMDFFNYRTQHPYYGFVECGNDGCQPFFMLTNNDDIVAEFYLWYGKNAYERTSIREWVRLVKNASVIYDVGANTGVFTLLSCFAADNNQQVVAFEPTSRACARIYENCNINGVIDRVKIEKSALSNRSGTLEFLHYENSSRISSGASYVAGLSHFDVHSRELCEATTLDEYIARSGLVPDLLKIDVEGAEIDVIEGARNLIASRKASFIIEVVPATVVGVLPYFEGYKVHLLDELMNRAVPFTGTTVDRYTNLLFEP